MKKLLLVLRIVAAGILMQTLYFKFTGAPESIYIFSQLGVEPWGRLFTGCIELVVSILLLIPATSTLGALMSLGVMGGAILSHIFILGIQIQNDGGTLFFLAVTVFLCSLVIVYFNRARLLENYVQLRKRF